MADPLIPWHRDFYVLFILTGILNRDHELFEQKQFALVIALVLCQDVKDE